MNKDTNINTLGYWNRRFSSGDWEEKGGRQQSSLFAKAQVDLLRIGPDFRGKVLDFGCGMGDAMPVYRSRFPSATLVGLDLSPAAIGQCRAAYGQFATFLAGDHTCAPEADVIIASNVFEHLTNDDEVAEHLLRKCRELYIVVPYKERIVPGTEHVNSYDETAFPTLGPREHVVFLARGWSQYGWDLWFHVYLKNLARPLFGKRLVRRYRQIMFRFVNPAQG